MTSALQLRSDTIGMWSSGLCLIHCAATPFLFVAKSCSAACCAASPSWWGWIDVGFLIISAVAIYFTAKHASKNWVKVALVAAWVALLFIIGNEYWHVINLAHYMIYAPALALIGLHFYNHRYCQCHEEECCVPTNLKRISA